VSTQTEDQLKAFRVVSLPELEERASLLHRVDRKYAVDRSSFLELLERLTDDHDVLDIDGRRSFSYRTVYFDTPELRCFREHIGGQTPRFKARTRLYQDTGRCVFEVKLKQRSGEMDKRQVDHPPELAEKITDRSATCLREALESAGLRAPSTIAPSLLTTFRRVTFAARGSSERLTCDQDVSLSTLVGATAQLSDGAVLVETKTENGDGAADRELARLGIDEVSLSKYRVGIGILTDVGGSQAQPGSELFAQQPGQL
jgi:VTC domain